MDISTSSIMFGGSLAFAVLAILMYFEIRRGRMKLPLLDKYDKESAKVTLTMARGVVVIALILFLGGVLLSIYDHVPDEVVLEDILSPYAVKSKQVLDGVGKIATVVDVETQCEYIVTSEAITLRKGIPCNNP